MYSMTFKKPLSSAVRVEIIEDYKLTRVGLKCALDKIEGIEVVAEAQNALMGIEIVKKMHPDIVLMDLGLPGMNGFEAMDKIKNISPNTKIVVLTAHDSEEDTRNSFNFGASAYCLKDIDPQTLSCVIKNVAKGAFWADSAVADTVFKMFNKPKMSFEHRYYNSTIDKKLTPRENEVLKLLVKGKSNTEIAKELVVSTHTAKAHVCSILQKFCVEDRVSAAVKAVKEGFVSI